MYFTNEDILKPLDNNNLVLVRFVERKAISDEWVDSMPNKIPVELSYDISGLSTSNLLTKLKTVQAIVDKEYDPLNMLAKNKDHIYHNTMGVMGPGYPVPLLDVSSSDNHLILLDKEKQSHVATSNNKIGYCFSHEILDSFEIYSKLSEILKIDISEFNFPNLMNEIQVINIKQFPAFPYDIDDTFKNESDAVSCYLVLNGDVNISVRPYFGSRESYSAQLSSTKLTAYNPYVLHALTTTTEEAYILNIRFNTMTFTRLLELANSK